MVWYPAYLDSKQDIVDWVTDQRPDLATGDIPDIVCRMTDARIFSMLQEENITCTYEGTVSGSAVTPTDINSFLWAASLAFNLEQLAMRGTIHYTHGGIAQTKFGQVTTTFMRQQPMFFIPRGTRGLQEVMPFQSYKQIGQHFIDAFIKARLIGISGTRVSIPQIAYDHTSRGYGWNAESGFMSGADLASSGMTW